MKTSSLSALAFVALFASSAAGQLVAQPVLRSQDGGNPIVIHFRNVLPQPVDIFWADFDGLEVFYTALDARQEYDQDSTSGHAWVFRMGGRKVGEYVGTIVARQAFDIGAAPKLKMALTSSAFLHGAALPKRFAAPPEGENVSPPLKWTGAPAETQEFALVCHDPDARGGDYTHWIVYGIPPSITEVREWVSPSGTPGLNSTGRDGYVGPSPPAGDKPHRYVFTIYAFPKRMLVPQGLDRTAFLNAIQGQVLAEASLTGTYQAAITAAGAQPQRMPARVNPKNVAAPGAAVGGRPGVVAPGVAVPGVAVPGVVVRPGLAMPGGVQIGVAGVNPNGPVGAVPDLGAAGGGKPIPGVGPLAPAARIQTGFAFTDGPLADGPNLYFADVTAGVVYKLDAAGRVSPFIAKSNGAYGLKLNALGEFIACELTGRVVAYRADGRTMRVVTDSFQGQRYNAPNDLAVDLRDGIYFTDPHYGAPQPLPQGKTAVYYVRATGETSRLIDDLAAPNGIALSPDEQTLYVVPSQSSEVMAYPIVEPGRLGTGRVFCTLRQRPGETDRGGDGATIDSAGNVYVATILGVQVFNASGRYLGVIEVPEQPSNCAFGGPAGTTLFITARKSLYAVPTAVAGRRAAPPAP
ncbi:MAG: YbhB/YbcL family Raf kinase inhibitor-like protein [Planctomycetaceae bacterium]|nr:YbhB/YbcL family Raf kinase inhibitor-like protein [Planctomycetaceae bacterium]